ncbi:cyanophycin synthetase family protein [Fannyhessea vaginae]|uniref:Cyanophycin synthase-like N-terminal domain-containing protein n=1 Tax=Fannyhessea vaginae DSM 15829 TaxID=525256 RepID=F1T6T3_9ACTN|nr:hypothetical protein [Fannyhessea vaginae]EGF22808.1 hypothetical protein HMPREF0091_11134 [Fannyhessea vaginae DSM 15829]QPR41422.1 hypothetical protein I6G91_04235 [Fannyhessea vaginae]SSZ03256.1 Uncharacterised protein [Fannyhessea vaginae]
MKSSYQSSVISLKKVAIDAKKFVATIELSSKAPLMTCDDLEATTRIYNLFPAIINHVCMGDASDTFKDVMGNTELAHLLEHVCVELLAQTNLAGDISAGKTFIAREDARTYTLEFICNDDVLVTAAFSSAIWIMNWAFGGARGTKPNVEAIVSGLCALIDSLPSELELPPEARTSVEDSATACDNAEGKSDAEACDNAEASDDVACDNAEISDVADHNGDTKDNPDVADTQSENAHDVSVVENADDEVESAESADAEPAAKTPADTESVDTESVDTASSATNSDAEASDELPIEPKPAPVPQETSRTTSTEDAPADKKTSRQNKSNSKRADLDGTMKLPRSRRIR